MENHRYIRISIGILLGLASLIFLFKQFYHPISPATSPLHAFHLSMTVTVASAPEKFKVTFPTPISTAHYSVVSQNLLYRGWSIQRKSYAVSETRGITFSARYAGADPLQAQYQIVRPNAILAPSSKPRLEKYLTPVAFTDTQQVELPAYAVSFLQALTLTPEKRAHLLGSIPAMIERLLMESDTDEWPVQDPCQLPLEIRAFIQGLRSSEVASRQVCGVALSQGHAQLRGWVEFYDDAEWKSVVDGTKDPKDGVLIPFVYDRNAFLAVSEPNVSYDIRFDFSPVLESQEHLGPPPALDRLHSVLSFSGFSYEMAESLKVVLLLPVLVALLAMIKLWWSPPLLGVLTPVLLSLTMAFKDTLLILGLILALLIPVILLQVLVKSFSKIIIYLISLAVAGAVFALFISGLEIFEVMPVSSELIVPIVIVIMTADKFSVAMAKFGLWRAVQKLGVTLLFALGGAYLLNIDVLGDWVFAYPEVNFLIAALALAFYPVATRTVSTVSATGSVEKQKKDPSKKVASKSP